MNKYSSRSSKAKNTALALMSGHFLCVKFIAIFYLLCIINVNNE